MEVVFPFSVTFENIVNHFYKNLFNGLHHAYVSMKSILLGSLLAITLADAVLMKPYYLTMPSLLGLQ